jgi:hypothetical protein
MAIEFNEDKAELESYQSREIVSEASSTGITRLLMKSGLSSAQAFYVQIGVVIVCLILSMYIFMSSRAEKPDMLEKQQQIQKMEDLLHSKPQ